jgi:hypothetical protein
MIFAYGHGTFFDAPEKDYPDSISTRLSLRGETDQESLVLFYARHRIMFHSQLKLTYRASEMMQWGNLALWSLRGVSSSARKQGAGLEITYRLAH